MGWLCVVSIYIATPDGCDTGFGIECATPVRQQMLVVQHGVVEYSAHWRHVAFAAILISCAAFDHEEGKSAAAVMSALVG